MPMHRIWQDFLLNRDGLRYEAFDRIENAITPALPAEEETSWKLTTVTERA